MRLFHKETLKKGRRVLALLLICGLLLPLGQYTSAASVTYRYDWITDAAGLPVDDGWHDGFIAWEDDNKKNTVWFTDYHWFTADSDSSIDVGGLLWMEYKSCSTLDDPEAKSFTSREILGHLQLKYAGWDSDNNSPKYYIRVSKMSGGYSYFTRSEPSDDRDDADAFTFQDKGDVFHIFVNISGQADAYLTRDGDTLETSLSSSSSSSEYPLRMYLRTPLSGGDSGSEDFDGDLSKVMGKVTMYEYSWVNTVEELAELTADKKTWHDVFLAWEDYDEKKEKSDPDTVWYTKEIWYDDGKPNYEVSEGFHLYRGEYYYWSNAALGSDGYSTPWAETFVMPEKVGHFQMRFNGWDKDNPVNGLKDEEGNKINSPKFYIRFQTSPNSYAYLAYATLENQLQTRDSEYTVQLFLDEKKKDRDDYYYGSVRIFVNAKDMYDNYLTRKGNRLDVSYYNMSDDWEFPFRIYTRTEAEYDAIVKSFTVGAGSTYSIDRHLILDEGVTITVENGGVLTVDRQLYNNGNILVKEGGTLIINEGGYITPYGTTDSNSGITLQGGNMIILDGGRVFCDEGSGVLAATDGASIINRGLLVVRNALELQRNSLLHNASTGTVMMGGRIGLNRGGVGSMTLDQLRAEMTDEPFVVLCSVNSRIINNGTILEPTKNRPKWNWDASGGGIEGVGGKVEPR